MERPSRPERFATLHRMSARLKSSLFTALVLVLLARPTLAYIGPGAGLAVGGSLLVLVGTFLMALGIILI